METTGKYASVCLAIDEEFLFVKKNDEEMAHLSKLLPMAQELLAESKLPIDDIDALAVSIGPGSFTGMRIGAAFARGISQAANIKCIAVNTLEAFTFSCGFESSEAALCAPMLDARRGQVYAALYEKNGETAKTEALATDVYMLDEYLRKLADYIAQNYEGKEVTIFFTGSGSGKFEEEIKEWANKTSQLNDIAVIPSFEAIENLEQSAENIAKAARKKYRAGEFTEYERLLPIYLRKSEAERKLDLQKQRELRLAVDRINI